MVADLKKEKRIYKMAFYFLRVSQTYCTETPRDIDRRREIICQHLTAGYKVPKNKDNETYLTICREIAETGEGIEITKASYIDDKRTLRGVYLWLTAVPDQKTSVQKNVSGASRKAISCLEKDGITTWSDISSGGETPRIISILSYEGGGAIVHPRGHRLRLWELQAGWEVEGIITQLVERIEDMLAENEAIKEEVTRLSEENQNLVRQCEDDESYIRYVEEENNSLEERVRLVKENMRHVRSMTLEEIAREHPEFPDLLAIARKLKESPATRLEQKITALQERLPQTFSWFNDSGRILYQRPFLHALTDFPQEEQQQVIRQMGDD
jgi:hypothetical protein